MRRDSEFFGESELQLIYIAKKLREALKLESLLTDSSVDYLVEPDKYKGGVIFQTERVGAFFYVASGSLENIRELLLKNGYRPFAG